VILGTTIAGAEVIRFEPPRNPVVDNMIEESGFILSAPRAPQYVNGGGISFRNPPLGEGNSGGGANTVPYNGTYHAVVASGSAPHLTRLNGLPFNLVSFDIAEYSASFSGLHSVAVTGYFTTGGRVTAQFSMDGVVEGQASDFQTLEFDAAWKGLRQVDIAVTHGPFSIVGFSIDNIHVEHAPWEASQFRSSDPVITFETGSTTLYSIPGVRFGGGVATFSRNAFGNQLFGNISGAGGFSILNVYFDEPKQAVGGHLINVNMGYLQGVYGVRLVVYDEHDNELQSEVVP
jgi:hypothetical protein